MRNCDVESFPHLKFTAPSDLSAFNEFLPLHDAFHVDTLNPSSFLELHKVAIITPSPSCYPIQNPRLTRTTPSLTNKQNRKPAPFNPTTPHLPLSPAPDNGHAELHLPALQALQHFHIPRSKPAIQRRHFLTRRSCKGDNRSRMFLGRRAHVSQRVQGQGII
jgi:hypothetical protein